MEAKFQSWRSNPRSAPQILEELSNAIEFKSFNSSPLLRMKTEVLLAQGNREEGMAAFNTYTSLQKLNLFKQKSGAHSLPDTIEDTVDIFSYVFTILENDSSPQSVKLIIDFGHKLEEMQTEFGFKESDIASVMCRSALQKLLSSQGDIAYEAAYLECQSWFPQTRNHNTDSLFANALFEALCGSPSNAFALVKRSLEGDERNLRASLLFVQLLSLSDATISEAKTIADRILISNPLKPHTELEKLSLLQLKKTQIALVEKINGKDAALEMLPDFVEFANLIYHVDEKAVTPKPLIRIESKRTLLGGIKREVSTVEGQSHLAPIKTHQKLATCWMWIALQYAKFGFEKGALEALEESRKRWPELDSIKAVAHSEALLGHIYRLKDQKTALKHYANSLSSYSLHISSAVSAVQIVCKDINKHKEFALLLLGFLESICMRSPGRFLPETWYSRAMLHEALNGGTIANEFYWKAIELEERRSVTSYLLLNAAV